MDKSRIRLGLLHKAIFLHMQGFIAKDIYFPYIIVFLKKGLITILGVVEPSVPATNGRQPFISKITLTLIFLLIPTHLVVETKP
jgi:hypothetical protein